jgi:hypothetical protein
VLFGDPNRHEGYDDYGPVDQDPYWQGYLALAKQTGAGGRCSSHGADGGIDLKFRILLE